EGSLQHQDPRWLGSKLAGPWRQDRQLGPQRQMNDALIALAGATIGGLTTVGAVFVAGRASARLESPKEETRRHEAFEVRLHTQIADVLRLLLQAEFPVYQVTWYAKYVPEQLDRDRIAYFEQSTERVLPELGGALLVLSGLDKVVHEELGRLADELAIMDGQVRLALHQERDAALPALAAFVEPLRAYYHSLPKQVAPLLRAVERRTAGIGVRPQSRQAAPEPASQTQ